MVSTTPESTFSAVDARLSVPDTGSPPSSQPYSCWVSEFTPPSRSRGWPPVARSSNRWSWSAAAAIDSTSMGNCAVSNGIGPAITPPTRASSPSSSAAAATALGHPLLTSQRWADASAAEGNNAISNGTTTTITLLNIHSTMAASTIIPRTAHASAPARRGQERVTAPETVGSPPRRTPFRYPRRAGGNPGDDGPDSNDVSRRGSGLQASGRVSDGHRQPPPCTGAYPPARAGSRRARDAPPRRLGREAMGIAAGWW